MRVSSLLLAFYSSEMDSLGYYTNGEWLSAFQRRYESGLIFIEVAWCMECRVLSNVHMATRVRVPFCAFSLPSNNLTIMIDLSTAVLVPKCLHS